MTLRRDHVERVFRRQSRVGRRRLSWWNIGWQCIYRLARLKLVRALAEQREDKVAIRGHRRLELALARWSEEVTRGMRRVGVRCSNVETRPSFLPQKIHCYPLKSRTRPIHSVQRHLFVAALPLPVIEAHGAGKSPEQRSEEHTSDLQSRPHLVCRLLLEKKKK